MRRRTVIGITVLTLLLSGCTKIYTTSGNNTTTPTAPTTPTVKTDIVEFRVFGSNLLAPATIKFIDPDNGLTIVTSQPPYFATVSNTADSVFLFLEASSFGVTTSTLQVQIFVNGKLFREGSSVGSVLLAQASGTFHR